VLDRLTEHMEAGMDPESQDATVQDPTVATAHVAAVATDTHGVAEFVEVAEDVPDGDVAALLAALEGADDLPLDERLQLLREAEASIAGALEGLDGL
jgi:hypothetical protein